MSRCSFCQGQDQNWTAVQEEGGDFVLIGHLEPPQWCSTCNQEGHKMETQLGRPVWVKRPGEEERMVQARLGPHPISIFSSELHHPESLAPKSQLPLWSIRGLGGGAFSCYFDQRGAGCQNETVTHLRNILTPKHSFYFSSERGFASRARGGESRSDIYMPEEVGGGEIHPPFPTSCSWTHQRAPVPSGCEQAERNLRPPPRPWSVSPPTNPPPAFRYGRTSERPKGKDGGWRRDW